ncbi:MAG: hypothetical protein H6656_14385 [Ardenticatenaceae bacterium]|nr:hypothetical protein [Ardenticatenaceae bacterium]
MRFSSSSLPDALAAFLGSAFYGFLRGAFVKNGRPFSNLALSTSLLTTSQFHPEPCLAPTPIKHPTIPSTKVDSFLHCFFFTLIFSAIFLPHLPFD